MHHTQLLLSGDGRSSLSAAGADPCFCLSQPEWIHSDHSVARAYIPHLGQDSRLPLPLSFMLELIRVKFYIEPLLETSAVLQSETRRPSSD